VVGAKVSYPSVRLATREMAIELFQIRSWSIGARPGVAQSISKLPKLIQRGDPLGCLKKWLKATQLCPIVLQLYTQTRNKHLNWFGGGSPFSYIPACPAFNADFDGDQDGSLCSSFIESQAEARLLMLNNIHHRQRVDQTPQPIECSVVAITWQQKIRKRKKGGDRYFASLGWRNYIYEQQQLSHAKVCTLDGQG